MELSEIMEQFAQKIGLADFAPDADGSYRLAIDDMTVSFVEEGESRTLATYAEIGDLPPEGVTALYRVLMEAMFMGQATGGSAFSVEPNSGKIFLHRVDSLAALDADAFSAMLEKFVNVLEQWRKLIADFRPVAGEVEKVLSDEPPMHGSGFLQV